MIIFSHLHILDWRECFVYFKFFVHLLLYASRIITLSVQKKFITTFSYFFKEKQNLQASCVYPFDITILFDILILINFSKQLFFYLLHLFYVVYKKSYIVAN